MFVKANAVFKMDFTGAMEYVYWKKPHTVPKHEVLKGNLNDVEVRYVMSKQDWAP